MRKKNLFISGILAASLTVAATMSGCSYASTNNVKDMRQVIAEVNITASEDFDKEFKKHFNETDYNKYKAEFGSSQVIKRELVSYFVNVGYSYYQAYGSTVFNQLVDQLTQTEVVIQYATTYLLMDMVENKDNPKYNANALKEYLEKKNDVERYEYLLGGKESDDVKIAEYSLLSSVNSAIDSYEKQIIEESNSNAGSATRAVPGNVDGEQDDYYPELDGKINYNIYTGYVGEGFSYSLAGSGTYQNDRDQVLKDGSTKSTRIRAYTKFLSSLIANNLVDPKAENLKDVRKLQYIQEEYVSQLQSRVLEKYYDMYEELQLTLFSEDEYDFIQKTYDDIFSKQQDTNKTEDTFGTVIGDMSDSSFILYAPQVESENEDGKKGTFGFVYNILLPFSASQSAALTAYKETYADEDVDSGYNYNYYAARNNILKNIKTTDQREAWFNGTTDYAFKAEDLDHYGASDYLFFKNNLTNNARYKDLDKYLGKYSYNGIVVEKDDKYILLPNELDIDRMLDEFSAYVNYALGGGSHVSVMPNTSYYDLDNSVEGKGFYKAEKNDDKKYQIDYAKLLYAEGQVNFGASYADKADVRANVLNKESGNQYKALSAVNELQYAYTTDTGVLSQYLGYSVEAGDTSYIKEFEYAAHKAVSNGAGSFAVCAGDYGWHLIYVTYAFNEIGADGKVYEPDWANKIKVEGTFENLFYEAMKSNTLKDVQTSRRSALIKIYNNDTTVKKYEKTYKDLLNLS